MRRALIRLLPAALTLAAATVTAVPAPANAGATTISVDNLRTGWDADEPGLAPSAVSASDFGQLFSTAVDGQVYAQPIVAAGTLVAVTENNHVYGMNPATGAVTWHRSVGPAWPASAIGCGDLVPNIGITSTPVYDPATGAVFFMAKVNDGPDADHPHFYLHSINPATGAERAGWPVTIQGSPTNDPATTFNAKTAAQRPGLLLLDGVVYAGFASHCDYGPYVGYVAGVRTTTAQMTTLWSTEAGRSNGMAGIWQSGGGLVSDGPGRIIVSTGNGVSPAPGPGTSPPGTLAESVIRLQVNGDGSLTAKDFFSPFNNSRLDQDDTDFGSGGPMALPAGFGTAAHPRLLVQTGKDGRVYLLDRDNLGGNAQGPGGGDASVGPPAGPYNGVWGHPAFWGGDGGYVYQVENQGFLRAFKYGVNGAGLPVLTSAGTSAATFGYTSGSPVVTSTGTTSGSAVVWAVYSDGSSGANGQLRAYDALPVNGRLNLRYSAPIGVATKFVTPATDGGRVFVGTRDGHVIGFGRPTTAALTSGPTDFGNVAVGSGADATVTVTATRAVRVTAVTTTAPFAATPPALPVNLTTGQTLSVPVRFTPTATGGATGSLTFTTDAGTVPFDLHGVGTRTGLGATPAALSFGTVPTGANKTLGVSVTNTGTTAVSITGFTAPAAPFTATGFPAAGTTLAAGASVSVSVRYAPTAAGAASSAFIVTSDAGSVTVPVTGTAVTGAPHLTITPNPVAFGQVPVGQTATQTFDIANTGNITLTLTKAAPPVGAFNTTTPVSEGQQLSPGDVIHQTVTFTPTTTGSQSAVYSITGDDGQGAVLVQLTGTGVTGTGNLAAGRPVTSSSAQGGYPASNAVDGDVNSYWESANNAFPQWIQVDLGASVSVGRVTLKLPPAAAWAARRQTVAVLDGATGAVLRPAADVAFDPATGNTADIPVTAGVRYLRLQFTGNTGWPAGQVSSLEVYGTGGGPATLTLSPASLAFEDTPVNANSDWRTVVVTNTGSGPATVSAITATGDYTRVTTCGSVIAAGANCTVTVTFHPSAAGTRTGTLTVASTATNPTATVALTGTGVAAGTATLTANPSALTFAATTVGSYSGAQNVTVTNTGTVAAAVSGVTTAGDYTATHTCGTSIAPGASCTVSVTFRPTATGARTGSLTVASNATNPALSVVLSGQGASASGANLALGRPTTQSSNTQSYGSGNAVDGNANTYWESANNAFPQWIQVDLGAPVAVGRVTLRLPPSTAWATRTQTVTVTDGATGAVLRATVTVTFDPAGGNTAVLSFPTATVRYLRVTVTANSGWPAGQLSELEAYQL
ncbi:choice-of-anchor D domain-containing protein [Dactylosporangium aurantiacum]|uniref:Choice-of-anchor D domain-containing protein n=1 Tax=Dactylosporangium aurantiacum TaxID=35754 RepID=A0A9Q9ICF8_9ACTN|nr:choice-of-anchor D domain-containing protein [Dactylosporangium aurantiacum]MDG6101533.1 choice-of-anchor D domain-containing protein [Dactylosporangium aurantiacum]UWZ52626.1 choice-of-anchor D domain-containing protein [Dactylosporangium aurantiacum]